VWAEPAPRAPAPRARGDRILAAVVLVAAGVEAVTRPDVGWRPAALGVGCVLAVAVLLRRTHGLAAVGLAFGAFVLADLAAVTAGAEPVLLYSGAVVLFLVYSLFRWGTGRDVVLGSGTAALGFTVSVLTDPVRTDEALGGAALLLFAAALGGAVRYRAVARAQLVEQVQLREREQLARELHDTVAHHLSAIAIQAQAGLVHARSSSPTATIDALQVIEREAAGTLAEMRAMVEVLRDRRAQPSLAGGRQLADIERLAALGTDSLRIAVELDGDLTDLPPALQSALYRVAQESVTNARRHASLATRVDVRVAGSATDVELTVSDDGAPRTGPTTPGYGLVGMTERVAMLGGTLHAGPRPDRGWCVHAVLPRPRSAT
jgi:signal transduction histidine kinase